LQAKSLGDPRGGDTLNLNYSTLISGPSGWALISDSRKDYILKSGWPRPAIKSYNGRGDDNPPPLQESRVYVTIFKVLLRGTPSVAIIYLNDRTPTKIRRAFIWDKFKNVEEQHALPSCSVERRSEDWDITSTLCEDPARV
jgi:hypothetical protein